MPYVPEKIRLLYKDTIDNFENMHAEKASAGEVTFLITALIHSWIKKQKWCYLTFCIAVGILVCCILELYRKVVAPYEDKKRMDCGGVSELDQITMEETR